ncbi:MAG: hypothetical protein SNJ67_02925 [Chloracidobacterium sp.]|uniref:Uncharacterized protein n=1 Tax=Chloracidobacterium validum TaxID=2821543 RepID=A0ABX8BFI4_9BACT|nr:hypothetical protein [Chloracidobacterium validum]QUW04439.1 hypothetical protein J8C06_11620 [Chloracidobacterium validum]
MADAAQRNAYDQAFKSLAEADPRALLALIGALPADAPAAVAPLSKELIASTRIADEIFLVETSMNAGLPTTCPCRRFCCC